MFSTKRLILEVATVEIVLENLIAEFNNIAMINITVATKVVLGIKEVRNSDPIQKQYKKTKMFIIFNI